MSNYLRYLEEGVESYEVFFAQLVQSLIIIFLGYLIGLLIKCAAHKIFSKEKTANKITRITRAILSLIILSLVAFTWFKDLKAFAIIFGLFLVFFTLALKDMVVDIMAYFYTSIRHPFYMGDFIEVEENKGEVVDMDIFQFNLLELGGIVNSLSPTGRYISLPNRYIFEKALINYSRGDPFIIQETYILVDFNEDMEKVMKIAGKVAYEKQNLIIDGYRQDDKAEKLDKFAKKLELTDYEAKARIRRQIEANGFRIYIQYFTSYKDAGKNRMIFENALFDAFTGAGIKMPVPQYLRIEKE